MRRPILACAFEADSPRLRRSPGEIGTGSIWSRIWSRRRKGKSHDPHIPHRDAGPAVEPRDKLDRLAAALDVELMNGGLGMPETVLMGTALHAEELLQAVSSTPGLSFFSSASVFTRPHEKALGEKKKKNDVADVKAKHSCRPADIWRLRRTTQWRPVAEQVDRGL